jgi:glycosyltransferase involved in cell wall biosynthesis
MKINLIIFISEFNLGGAGNSLFRLCVNLPKKKYNINVICLNKCAYEKELKKNKITIYKIFSKKTTLAMFEVKKITKQLISTKYKKNIFISNIHYSNILSIIFLKNLKIKLIIIERTPLQELSIYFNFKDLIKKIFMKILISFTYKHAHLCISNSNYISSEYNKLYNLKFISIFPPSFVEEKNLKKKNIFNNKPFIIGTVCRLSREKGLSEFLITIAKLKSNLKLKFIIIGDGPEENELKKLSIKLGIEKNIIFQGFLNYKEIKQKLKTFDIYINCSHFEGFPNSVVESLSNGIPVLASQSHGGINDIINNKKFGYIYKNEKDLMKILLNIYNKKKTFKLNKRETIAHLKKFSLSKSIKQYSKVFENI